MSKVNKLTEGVKAANDDLINFEESLENLDLFRATNLGRLLQGGADNKDPVRKSTDKKRQSWGMSPGTNRNLDSSKHKMAHVLVKNPFPEQIMQ